MTKVQYHFGCSDCSSYEYRKPTNVCSDRQLLMTEGKITDCWCPIGTLAVWDEILL